MFGRGKRKRVKAPAKLQALANAVHAKKHEVAVASVDESPRLSAELQQLLRELDREQWRVLRKELDRLGLVSRIRAVYAQQRQLFVSTAAIAAAMDSLACAGTPGFPKLAEGVPLHFRMAIPMNLPELEILKEGENVEALVRKMAERMTLTERV